MNTAVNAISATIFSGGSAVSAYAQNSLFFICACGLAVTIALAPFVAEAVMLRHIIKKCGKGSKEFKQYSKVLRSRGKSPPD